MVCIKWAAPWENQKSAYAKTKAQISFAVTAKLISAFVFAAWIVQSFFLNPKFQVSSLRLWLYRSYCVGPVQKPHCWFSHEVAQMLAKDNVHVRIYNLNKMDITFKFIYTNNMINCAITS